jgi:hypothetical protein
MTSFFIMVLKRTIWLVLWTIVILIIVGIPGSYIPKTNSFLNLLSPDKIVHLLMFGPFAFFLKHLFQVISTKSILYIHSSKAVILFGIVFGISTELLQYYIFIGRNGNVYDAIADSVGIILGVLLYPSIVKRTPKWFRR